MAPNIEEKNYNALNILLAGDYRKLKNAFDKYNDWNQAWENLKTGNPAVNLEQEWQKLEILGIKLILKNNPSYPASLKEIPWPPFAIYMKGSLPNKNSIAIVGTRRATSSGKNMASQIAQELCSAGMVVASGLAMGIDEAAHRGAINANGITMAILPCGLDKIYPAQNSELAQKILEKGGALISEYPLNSTTYPANFIQRNRIVSGLSLATVVIEAPEKSGALATTRFALEQGREVFVVPGSAAHPNYKGSHQLIRDGARLATSAQEILDDLGIDFEKTKKCGTIKSELSIEENKILETIKELGWPASIDKIFEKTKIDIPKINQTITLLTIKGLLK